MMMKYYGKIAGEEAALNAFGLAHGTPRPPPTWAQEWLETASKNGTKNLTIPSMREKKAFEPISMGLGALGAGKLLAGSALGSKILGTLGAGAGWHVGGNLLQKAIRKFAPGLAQRQFASGLAHGAAGQKIHPVINSLAKGIGGPEYLAQYEAGQAAAKQLAGIPAGKRDAYLRQAGNLIKETSHLKNAPIAEAMPGGIDKYLKNEHGFVHKHLLRPVPSDQKTPFWQKAVAPVALGAAGVAHPHIGAQFAVNAIRDRMANSAPGRKFMANELAQGARGKDVSPLRRKLTDLFLSPAVNDPRDIGLAANKEYGAAQKNLNDLAAAHGHGPVPLPGAAKVTDFAENVYNRLNAKKPAAPVASAPAQPSGAMTKALLAGGGLYALSKQRDREEATA